MRCGVTRTVLLIWKYAVKFPSWRNGTRYFLLGLLGNRLEWEHWQMTRHHRLAPVLHCGPMGLWLVMSRCHVLYGRRITDAERADFPFLNMDDNGQNLGVYQGRLVLVDYGNVGWMLDVGGVDGR